MAFNQVYTIVGARNQGKTPFILGGDYEEGLANIFLSQRHMSVLIIDELDHPKYRHVPFLHPSKYLSVLSPGGKIFRTLAKKQDMPKLFPYLADVWNTLIVFEDCYKYMGEKFTDDQIAVIGNSKNQNNDLAFMHWCWGFVQPDLLRMTNHYVIFKTSDSPECRKQYIRGCYDECMKAHEVVSQRKSGLPYVVVTSGI